MESECWICCYLMGKGGMKANEGKFQGKQSKREKKNHIASFGVVCLVRFSLVVKGRLIRLPKWSWEKEQQTANWNLEWKWANEMAKNDFRLFLRITPLPSKYMWNILYDDGRNNSISKKVPRNFLFLMLSCCCLISSSSFSFCCRVVYRSTSLRQKQEEINFCRAFLTWSEFTFRTFFILNWIKHLQSLSTRYIIRLPIHALNPRRHKNIVVSCCCRWCEDWSEAGARGGGRHKAGRQTSMSLSSNQVVCSFGSSLRKCI